MVVDNIVEELLEEELEDARLPPKLLLCITLPRLPLLGTEGREGAAPELLLGSTPLTAEFSLRWRLVLVEASAAVFWLRAELLAEAEALLTFPPLVVVECPDPLSGRALPLLPD